MLQVQELQVLAVHNNLPAVNLIKVILAEPAVNHRYKVVKAVMILPPTQPAVHLHKQLRVVVNQEQVLVLVLAVQLIHLAVPVAHQETKLAAKVLKNKLVEVLLQLLQMPVPVVQQIL